MRYAAPCCLPAMPFISPCSAEPNFDFKYLKYLWIIDMIGWFFGLKSKFLPDSREAREVRERGSTGSLSVEPRDPCMTLATSSG